VTPGFASLNPGYEEPVMNTPSPSERIARCACGQLTLTARGEPVAVYLCSCFECQRRSGAAFSYAAIYPTSAIAVAGEEKSWRRDGDSGRAVEMVFCPTCAVSVYSRSPDFPDTVGVAVGCFADPDFAKPKRVYWASRRHHWLTLPDGVERVETQPG
jgi:hypothetical protein